MVKTFKVVEAVSLIYTFYNSIDIESDILQEANEALITK